MMVPTWLFIVLIVTNGLMWLFVIGLINLVCYLHDMIKVSIDMKREEKKRNEKEKNR